MKPYYIKNVSEKQLVWRQLFMTTLVWQISNDLIFNHIFSFELFFIIYLCFEKNKKMFYIWIMCMPLKMELGKWNELCIDYLKEISETFICKNIMKSFRVWSTTGVPQMFLNLTCIWIGVVLFFAQPRIRAL